MEQKKFMDISRIKEDTELTVANTGGFHVGDHIVIQEKWTEVIQLLLMIKKQTS